MPISRGCRKCLNYKALENTQRRTPLPLSHPFAFTPSHLLQTPLKPAGTSPRFAAVARDGRARESASSSSEYTRSTTWSHTTWQTQAAARTFVLQ